METHPPSDSPSSVLGYARLNEKTGTRVYVFYNRVLSFQGGGHLVSPLLGHVIAHEIAHVVQGVRHHSREGVLKARWEPRDFAAMAVGGLRFSPEDLKLIRQALHGSAAD